jgi:hypothetical protein
MSSIVTTAVRRPSRSRAVVEPRDAVSFKALDPRAHRDLAALKDLGNARDGVATIREQDHMDTLAHTSRLYAGAQLQVAPLGLAQPSDKDHPLYTRSLASELW